MNMGVEKQKRLAYVARRYYLEGRKQSEIARDLGSAREVVTRMLRRFAEEGLVELRRGAVEVKDLRGLERIAGEA